VYRDSMETLGALLGSAVDAEARQWLKGKVDEHGDLFRLLQHAAMPSQIAMLILRLCIVPSMGYLSRTMPPDILMPSALEFDALVLRTFAGQLGLPNPLPDLAKKTICLPIRLGGVGLRPVASSLHIAYFSAAALAAPGIVQLCPVVRREATFAGDPSRMGFTAIIARSLEHIKRLVPAAGDSKLVPESMAAFWRLYAVQGMAKKLQSVIAAQVELGAVQDLRNSDQLVRADRQRLQACAARNAGAWLTVVPTCAELRLSDVEYRQAMRLRLGLPPADDLPRKCVCGGDLRVNTGHLFSCEQLKRGAVTTRHDRMVQCLAKLFRSADAVVRVEERIEGKTRRRPDLVIVTPEQTVYVDVAIVLSSAPSRSAIMTDAAIEAMEADKKAKYAASAQAQGASFRAFVLDAYGGWGKEATELLGMLRDLLDGSNILAAQTLAVAL
jgi:hypothetical protein